VTGETIRDLLQPLIGKSGLIFHGCPQDRSHRVGHHREREADRRGGSPGRPGACGARDRVGRGRSRWRRGGGVGQRAKGLSGGPVPVSGPLVQPRESARSPRWCDRLLAKYEQVVAYRGLPGRAGTWGSENKAGCRGLLWSGLWSAFSLVALRDDPLPSGTDKTGSNRCAGSARAPAVNRYAMLGPWPRSDQWC
jgi:hypothetical protein